MPLDWLKPETLYTLVCRPALPKDTPDVMELTSTIWEGDDYVPYVWSEWLADPHGLLAVAEWGGRVVGLSKLTRLSEGQWWLEGLRVHPQYEGRGIASHLHDYLLGVWERSATGCLRLATASFRKPVQHLSERSGFRKAGEVAPYAAQAIQPPVEEALAAFQPITLEDLQQAMEIALHSPAATLTYGLMDLGWEWARPEAGFLEAAVQRGGAWWWRPGREALLIMDEDDEGEDEPRTARVQLLAGQEHALAGCLQDFRSLAASQGFERASWQAPLHPELLPILEGAGYQRTWDASIYLYEKEHPTRA